MTEQAIQSQPEVAGIFSTEEQAAEAVEELVQHHFDPAIDVSVIVSHRREHEKVPVREKFEVGHGGAIGAAIGAVLATAGVVMTGMTVGPLTLVASGPLVVALEAAFAGGAAGFALGAAEGLGHSKHEAEFDLAHIHEGVVWVGVHAGGERAELAREVLRAAGAKHFQS